MNTKQHLTNDTRKHTGVFFILLGLIYFAGISGAKIFGYSPWVLMALVPVYWIGVAAYRAYKTHGRLNSNVLLMLVFGLMPFAFVAAGLLGLKIGTLWPIGLILMGLIFLLSNDKIN